MQKIYKEGHMDIITTQAVIDELMNAFPENQMSGRQRYMLEQTLHNLVRLAKAEKMMEIKSSVRILTEPLKTMTPPTSIKATHRH